MKGANPRFPLVTSTLSVRSFSGQSQQAVDILVGFPRGTLANVQIQGLPEGLRAPAQIKARGNLIRFAWAEPTFPGGGLLRFTAQAAAPLSIYSINWLPTWSPPIAAAYFPNFSELLLGRKEDIWLGNPIKARECCKEFLKDYDARFLPTEVPNNPDMTEEQKRQRLAAVGAILPILVTRRDERAKAARSGTVPNPATMPRPAGRDDVAHLSDAQLALIRECFSDGAGGIDYAAFQECFERFANGELRNPANPGEREPDGGFFFLFAEFAFLAIAMSINSGEWSKLLRTFVKTQEIFMNTYRPPQAAPTLDDYGPDEFREPQQATGARKRQLRQIYDDLSPGELEDRARSNMQRAQA